MTSLNVSLVFYTLAKHLAAKWEKQQKDNSLINLDGDPMVTFQSFVFRENTIVLDFSLKQLVCLFSKYSRQYYQYENQWIIPYFEYSGYYFQILFLISLTSKCLLRNYSKYPRLLHAAVNYSSFNCLKSSSNRLIDFSS